MSWKRITDEKPGNEYRDKVLRAAEMELSKRQSDEIEDFGVWRRRWLIGGAVAAFAAIIYRHQKQNENAPAGAFSLLAETELLENMEIVERLDLLEDLDVLMDDKAGTNG